MPSPKRPYLRSSQQGQICHLHRGRAPRGRASVPRALCRARLTLPPSRRPHRTHHQHRATRNPQAPGSSDAYQPRARAHCGLTAPSRSVYRSRWLQPTLRPLHRQRRTHAQPGRSSAGRAACPHLAADLGAYRHFRRLLVGPCGGHSRTAPSAQPRTGKVTSVSGVPDLFTRSVVYVTADAMPSSPPLEGLPAFGRAAREG